ncbi:dTDP-4-dehydrorhamnose 3,5-epimerase [Ichthyenterobacterium sp. W332]|uniref:dTDP-4-dehydrorhamnose 3,5-epimerase n=1 Tax=Microcosmobacter mediterraneus TaxID=3075607 RepID=A0ABU2YJQ5_9FLAO|nr:dTDP-4-dehydrorhamnose 3,5-epimerase [Ichthyenterobacterium sp. W332]MDT0558047.1 dTDP-4-dehydrorhamnose 3,5-epimerase [Ichthyenterobacterium sp. W332]
MIIEQTNLEDCFIITPNVLEDDRGYFFESFNRKKFEDLTDMNIDFVQDNQSKSSKGVLRGLHFQKGDYAQAKLVRVLKGSVLDVAVDLRPNSKTFSKSFSVKLDTINNKQLFIPRGFAHGFLVLENDTIFSYKCDNYYNKLSESGILYNDQTLAINWEFKEEELILSPKDLSLPMFNDLFS